MKNLLNIPTLVYLSFHLIGLLFCMAGMFGVPGQLDDTNPRVKRVIKAFDLFLNLSWIGIPILIVASVVVFYLEKHELGILFSTISMSLGLAAFLCMVTLYKIKT